MSESPLKVWLDRDGTLLRLRLARPKANIIDAAMIAALDAGLVEYRETRELRAVLLDHEGSHFSFGASVVEHLPGQCAEMLKALHTLVRSMLNCPLPLLVAIKGQCLGGGLEVATAGSMLFAAPDVKLGQPEIKLGVFAPAASCLLPERIGQAKAEDLLVSGRSMDAEEALATGLVDSVSENPEATALAYFDQYLAPSSASTLRFAVLAARQEYRQRVLAKLERVEALYLAQLMETRDAVEGLTAFLEKRQARWENR
ncbi:MAG: cyclohexa-1,5-dienecarbonyl-CoA hydratase [Desulfuromonadales bacterium]